ncbi:hypothetical protein PybrP1_004868, partial [[Pythium] brassicae (nom. inval.)]
AKRSPPTLTPLPKRAKHPLGRPATKSAPITNLLIWTVQHTGAMKFTGDATIAPRRKEDLGDADSGVDGDLHALTPLVPLMTALPSHRRALSTAPFQSPDRKDTCTAVVAPPAESRSGVVDAWRWKLRLPGDDERHESVVDTNGMEPKRKRASFIKALFKHDRHAPTAAATKQPESNQTLDERSRPTLPVTPPSTGRWQDLNGAVTVGGRRVPFTLDAHRRLRTKRSRVLASITEARPTQTSAEAYRRRAYYPAKPASAKKAAEKAKKPQTKA